MLVQYFSARQILFLLKEFTERDSNRGPHLSRDTKRPLYHLFTSPRMGSNPFHLGRNADYPDKKFHKTV